MLNNPIAKHLQDVPYMLLDGGLATELEQRGCDLNDPLWSAKVLFEAPEIIRDVHMDYLWAGADCVTTASYQATIQGFMKRGLSDEEARRLLCLSIEVARDARDTFWSESNNRNNRSRPIVAASVGPYGAYLHDGSEYHGNYTVSQQDLIDFHRERVKILLDAGADIIAFETLPSLYEARALLRLLEEFPEASAWFSFSAKDGRYISHGERFDDCVRLLSTSKQVAGIGINCTAPKHIPSLVQSGVAITDKPIIVYPNCGEVYDASDNSWHGEQGCENFAEQAQVWYQTGAKVIGGCCRTTPQMIKDIASRLKQNQPTIPGEAT